MIPDEIVETMPDLLRTAIEITDTFRDELIAQYGSEGHRALKLVKARIDRADVAVWPDNAAAYRVGYCVLKGANIIREYLATGVPVTSRKQRPCFRKSVNTPSSEPMAHLTLQQRAYLMGFRRAQARARVERERLADRFEETVEAIHEEMAAVRPRLYRVELEEAECDPKLWLH